jgi:hypothetical protein
VSDYHLLSTSPAIDAGTDVGLTTDYAGNPIYGAPDIGGYEYQPPYTMGTDGIPTTADTRTYGDEKFRNKTATTSDVTADLSVTIPDADKTQWLDIGISTWDNTGLYHKAWNASTTASGLTNTVYVVGDLEANKYYNVKLDNVLGQNITGTDCTAGICKSNSSGKITFTYTGTYSDHTFDVQEGDNTVPVRSSGSPSGTLAWNTTSATLSLTTDENATCKYGTSANTAYSSIANTFTTTGATTHSASLTGLSSNTGYTYYVRCQDTVGNANSDDYLISFSLAAVPGGGSHPKWNEPPQVPIGGFNVSINNGIESTTNPFVILSLRGGPEAAEMAISNFPDFRDARQKNYATIKIWNLCWQNATLQTPFNCPAGTYTVYAKFYASWGKSSETVSNTIIYKTDQSFLSFSKYLRFLQVDSDVKLLQIFLNKDPDTKVADSGLGSPGKETTFFGSLTKAAVIKFQEKYAEDVLTPLGLAKGTGFVGKTTKAKLNELMMKQE